MYKILSVVVLCVTALYTLLLGLIHWSQDPREPPVLLYRIPFFTPVISILSKRFRIYLHLLLPMYTVRLPFCRLYIVNETKLVTSIERQAKIIALQPIEAKACSNLLGMSDHAKRTMRHDPTSEEGHFITFHKAFSPSVAPGPNLDMMVSRAVNSMQTSLHNARAHGPTRTRLYKWIQHEITIATTDAEFGPGNPFRCPEFEKAWFELESGVPFMATNVLPTLLARKSVKAREFLTKGFAEYFRCGHHKSASKGVLARLDHSLQAGFTMDDVARGEVGSTMAILNNSIPAAFWTLHHVFSDPFVLTECRKEVNSAMRVDQNTRTLDFSVIKSSCPAIQSTFQEVLRYRGIGNLVLRQVLQDHVLDDRFLVKKGGIVVIPNAVQHFKNEVWGDDASEFQHRRFVSSDTSGSLKRFNQAAFRPFGGGFLHCPGRHFATTEILCFTALMVASFDIKPVQDTWASVKTERAFGLGVARLFLELDADIDVEIQPRGDVDLRFALTGAWDK